MRNLVMLIGCAVLLAACSTTETKDKDRPRVGVIGHGTNPGSSWAGVGVTIPFPGKSSTHPVPDENPKRDGTSTSGN